eukprot:756886-Hanusia_phi.AAC.3
MFGQLECLSDMLMNMFADVCLGSKMYNAYFQWPVDELMNNVYSCNEFANCVSSPSEYSEHMADGYDGWFKNDQSRPRKQNGSGNMKYTGAF